MFKEWGFLLTEIWVLLALAVLLGLLAGWLIWGGRKADDGDGAFALQMQLDRERARAKAAEDAAEQARSAAATAAAELEACRAAQRETPVLAPDQTAPQTPDPVAVPTAPQAKPQSLDAARDGLPDDLTKISGIGPKLSALCNRLGFYHFDQIAAWTEAEIAWVDDNLEGFKGRVTRDNWVAQAKALAKNTAP